MKPANFPARKNARRARALERLSRGYVRPDGSRRDPADVDREALAIGSKLNPAARAIRTKKVRAIARA